MSLKATPSYWREEIKASQAVLRNYLGPAYDQIIANFTGGRHGRDAPAEGWGEADPENHAFEWIALMQGQAVPGIPQVKLVSADAMGDLASQAMQAEIAVNELLIKSGFRREMLKVFTDFAMRWGVAKVKPKPQLGARQWGDPPSWPQAMRVSLKDYFFDPRALDAETRRWQGDRVRADKDDVLEEAREDKSLGWNLELLETLIETTESSESSESDRPKIRWGGGPDRKMVEWIECWVPEMELEWGKSEAKRFPGKKSWREAGFNGLVLTVPLDCDEAKPGNEDDEGWVRDPRPFFGPPSGPYEFFRGYDVPDDPCPMSNISSVENQVDYLNDIVVAMNRSALSWKRLVFVSNEDPTLPLKIESGEHDNVLTTNVGDLGRGIQKVEVGGTSEEQIMAADIAKNRLNKASGLDDAQRGNVTGEGTATEVMAASQASAARIGTPIGNFREGMVGLISKMVWYIWNDHNFIMQVGPEAAGRLFNMRTGELAKMPPIAIQGGSPGPDGKPQAMAPNFDAISVTLHTFSVTNFGTTNPQQQLMEYDQAAMTYLPLISDPRFLHVDWAKYFADRRRLVNGPDFSGAVDFEIARKLAMTLLQAQLDGGDQPQAEGSPTPAFGQGSKSAGPSWKVGSSGGGSGQAGYKRAGGLLERQKNSTKASAGSSK